MSTDLQRPERQEIVIPVVGQVLDLNGPVIDRAEALDEIREVEHEFRSAKRAITDSLLRDMDFNARYTLREGPFELKGDGPGRIEYDGDALALTLAGLVDEGLISEKAAVAACETVTTYKPRSAGIRNLLKQGGRVAELIDKCGEPMPDAKRRVSVKRTAE